MHADILHKHVFTRTAQNEARPYDLMDEALVPGLQASITPYYHNPYQIVLLIFPALFSPVYLQYAKLPL